MDPENDMVHQLKRAAEFALAHGFNLSICPEGVKVYKSYGRGAWQCIVEWLRIEQATGNEVVSVMQAEIDR